MKKEIEEEWKWKPADNEEEIGGDMNIWNPAVDGKVGDELVGEVVALEEGMYGIEANIKERGVDDATGKPVIWTTPAHRILQTALAKLAVGDNVRMTYIGAYTTQNGQTAKNYRVARRK